MSTSNSPPLVPIVRPSFDNAEAEAVANVVRSGWLMQGPQVQRFESALAAYLGEGKSDPAVVAVSNGTAALELALRALHIGPGDEVITVSHSFIATANCILAVGATPVFVDVQSEGLSMDPAQVQSAISTKTKAILCVHQLGHACDLEALLSIASGAGIPLIEDAACALGTEILLSQTWQRIGRPAGHIACFSFHPRKVITTGEGGAISTNDTALADRLRLLRQHAIPAAAAAPDPNLPDGYAFPAFNARMTDMSAAIGLAQLAKLPALLAERHAQAAALHQQLAGNNVLAPATQSSFERPNWQSYAARIRPRSRLSAAQILSFLKQQGISARGGLTNAHEEPAYTNSPGNWRAGSLAASERLRREVIMLPIFPGLTLSEKDQLASALKALGSLTPGP
jgi:perosamine synthetase